MIATSIVHEATHGMLFRRGIGYPEELRDRIEKVCSGQEMAFASKLPPSETVEELRNWARERDQISPDYWKEEGFAERTETVHMEMLEYAHVPPWMKNLLLRHLERRRKRLRAS